MAVPVADLRRFPMLAALDGDRLAALAETAAVRACAEGELVLDFDDHSTDVYFIVSGDVRVLVRTAAGKEMILGDFGAGKFFGEMAAIDGAKRSANVTALTNAEILLVPPGVWHTARIDVPTVMLFVTPGEGTEHRPVDAG